MKFKTDRLVFKPRDVDLTFSPMNKDLDVETFVLGAFNPGMTRLPNGNLLIMVRIAEALKNPVYNGMIHSIRWSPDGYLLDAYSLSDTIADDPRKFYIKKYEPLNITALTSLSWLLPVELAPDGLKIIKIHYDHIISPNKTSQEYGIEDARISLIDGIYWMTTCTVSSERHATTLYKSTDALNWQFEGIILDHQNKDMLLFEGKIGNKYYALTRPLGSLYFPSGLGSEWYPGPSIHLAESPDLLHWKPADDAFIRARKASSSSNKIGGGTPPILTEKGWLILWHGVETKGEVGIYRTFWAMLDKKDPENILYMEDQIPVLESVPKLTEDMKEQLYLTDVVFTTGIVDAGDKYIVTSGENDLACRITHIPKSYFKL